jgi:hypothetical protein
MSAEILPWRTAALGFQLQKISRICVLLPLRARRPTAL